MLTTYPVNDASRRLRIEPLVAEMRRRGVDVRVHELLSAEAFAGKNGSKIQRLYAAGVLSSKILSRLFVVFQHCDILLVHREAFPFFTPIFERIATRRAKVAVLDVDDAIYAPPTHTRDWRQRLRKPARALELKNYFDMIFCGNEMLRMAFCGGRAATELYPTCPPLKTFDIVSDETNEIALMWTGSQSTLGSLRTILPDVLRFCEEEGLHFYILGGENVAELPPHSHMTAARWTEDAESYLLRRSSIGLMPLPDTEWERGKSGYKAILYLCAGIRAVVSPVGINRLLCEDFSSITSCGDDEWVASLRNVVAEVRSNGVDRSSRHKARARFDSAANAVRAVDAITERVADWPTTRV